MTYREYTIKSDLTKTFFISLTISDISFLFYFIFYDCCMIVRIFELG